MAHRNAEPAQPSSWRLGPSALCAACFLLCLPPARPGGFAQKSPPVELCWLPCTLHTTLSTDTSFYARVLASLPFTRPRQPASSPFSFCMKFSVNICGSMNAHGIYEMQVWFSNCVLRYPEAPQQVHRVLGNILDFPPRNIYQMPCKLLA